MPRRMLTDEIWPKLKAILLQDRVYDKLEHRQTVDGILYRMRTGCPWRDVPADFGKWNTIYRRFNLWSKKGVIGRLFKALSGDTDLEWSFLDGSIVRAHQHSAGASTPDDEAIGRSRGGKTTKTDMAVDSYGLPVHFELTGGQVHDSQRATELIEKVEVAQVIIADKGYDSEVIRAEIRKVGAIPVIPRKRNSQVGNDRMDWCLYGYRHLVENAFARLKHFRAIATRYDKLARNYASMVNLGCCMMWIAM